MDTIEEVKNDPEFMCSLELPEFKFNVYLIYQGTEKLKYYAFLNGEKLFEGKDFKPSHAAMRDSVKTLVECVAWLTLKPGDTDREYFKKYSERQLAWAKSPECEELSCYVSGFEEGDSNDVSYFEMRYANGG